MDNDLLVYDSINDQVHLLNSSAAVVFALMESGAPLTEIEKKVSDQYGIDTGPEMLAMAVDQISTAGLFDEAISAPPIDTTRRAVLQKVAAAGLGILLPAILTITPSKTYAQGSVKALGAPCDLSAECASGCCQKGEETACPNKTCVNPATQCAQCR
ncbi:MAG TPA: hypothetical protein VM099_17285 [Gemmatimonadaceae bacterium]|nr:hypothetical protein [Gemmatimonadaceae bacterium]